MKKLGLLIAGGLLAGNVGATMLDFNFADIASFGSDWHAGNQWGATYGHYVSAAGTQTDAVKARDEVNSVWGWMDPVYAAAGAEGWTPNVTTPVIWDYTNQRYADTGFGDLAGVTYADNGWLINLTPDAGYQVKIHSFDLALAGADDAISLINIYDSSSAIVWSAGGTTVEGDTHTGFTPNYTGALGEALRIRVWNGDMALTDIALDNLLVSQIPEPATLSLVGMASLGILVVRRKLSM